MVKTIKRLEKIRKYNLPIKISEEKEGGFIAVCPQWQVCYAQGDTIDEAASEILSVAASLIEIYQEEGLKIPLKARIQKAPKTKDFSFEFPVIVPA
ncbi:type II toxin-antitoxin system HicB family antitoxin [Patescibacteria group bacterium]|nr:type II toxin-antitoxin system HicB family antitoxin [Patescibacteria group bacterium]MBU1931133.1 type II toxin-antitoxin system HicB family antitoxin [Patescibacteria group bacterium]